jgi:hypothetical protein
VLLITGTGLKDVAAATAAVPKLEPVEPTLEAIEERILNSEFSILNSRPPTQ